MSLHTLCDTHILLLRELISGESVVDNWNSSKVEAIVLILKGSVAVLHLKCLLTAGKDRLL